MVLELTANESLVKQFGVQIPVSPPNKSYVHVQ